MHRNTQFQQGLTHQQLAVFDALYSFMAGPERVFILKGYAGTGKTFLIKQIAAYLAVIQRSCQLAAPTGRAARVLEARTGLEAGTLHRLLYSMTDVDECEDWEDDEQGRKKQVIRFSYKLRQARDDDNGKVIIVDEASMISDAYSEMEYIRFGSGYLLRDLLEYARSCSKLVDSKIIFVGDPAQLPPVNMNSSPALDADYMEKQYHIACAGAVLTDVVRQHADSAILRAAMDVRNRLESTWRKQVTFKPCPGELECITSAQAVYASCLDDAGAYRDDSIVVSYTNATALRFNLAFREKITGEKGDAPVFEGDRLMVVANNGTYGLCNGDLVYVSRVGTQEKRIVPHHDTTLVFRDVEVVLKQLDGDHTVIPCKMIENVLYSAERQQTTTEYKALYADFCIRHDGLSMKKDREAFVNALMDDPYFNALQVKFGYAVTCHKAQGGEWDRVVVLMEHEGRSAFHHRWLYTAITRARRQLLLYRVIQKENMTQSGLARLQKQAALRRKNHG